MSTLTKAPPRKRASLCNNNSGNFFTCEDIYFFPVRFPTESRVLIGWRAVRFSPYVLRNRTAPLVEQVLSKQVFSFIFSKTLAVIITLEWTTKAFTAKVSSIYILKSKLKQIWFVCFFGVYTMDENICPPLVA